MGARWANVHVCGGSSMHDSLLHALATGEVQLDMKRCIMVRVLGGTPLTSCAASAPTPPAGSSARYRPTRPIQCTVPQKDVSLSGPSAASCRSHRCWCCRWCYQEDLAHHCRCHRLPACYCLAPIRNIGRRGVWYLLGWGLLACPAACAGADSCGAWLAATSDFAMAPVLRMWRRAGGCDRGGSSAAPAATTRACLCVHALLRSLLPMRGVYCCSGAVTFSACTDLWGPRVRTPTRAQSISAKCSKFVIVPTCRRKTTFYLLM